MTAPLRIVHIITSLEVGGAEGVLLRLLQRQDRARVRSTVIALRGGGALEGDFRRAGIPVHGAGFSSPRRALRATVRLARLLRRAKPDVVQTWLYHGDIVGGLVARAAGVSRVVWNLRMTEALPSVEKSLTRAFVRFGAWSSRVVPDRIVTCSQATARVHRELGYDASRFVHIPNGFTLPREPQLGMRGDLGLAPDALVVGRVARFHPMKDHNTFALAAARVASRSDRVVFLLCGDGMIPENAELAHSLSEAGVLDRCLLLGRQHEMAPIYATLDVLCSSSRSGEGFPNVIGEAMAAGVPVVATDVGDSARLVGEMGVIVPPERPEALATGINGLLELEPGERLRLGRAARQRVAEEFSLDRMVESYTRLYEELATYVRD